MNLFEKILYFLQKEMPEPTPFGWYHLLCIGIMLLFIVILFIRRKKHNDKQLKIVLATYGIIVLVLEILKQLTWSFNYDPVTQLITWDYEWYAFPFQLCTTPIYISLICLFLKKGKLRDALLSYLAFFTILGSISTILLPESCFVEDILVNIHTMYLHLGSFVISVYLLFTKEVKLNKKNFISATFVFLSLTTIAEILNISIYHSGILNGETFNMFYISPYFISSLPVFDIIQENVPYIIYLLIYILALTLGALIIYFISLGINKLLSKKQI
jgi:hypothetical protein